MKRRSFISILSGAAIAPALPVGAARAATVSASAGSGYARLLYGLSVYHAETSGTISAAQLMPRLGVSATRAKALMSEMISKGVLSPAASVNGVFRTADATSPRQLMTRFEKWLEDWFKLSGCNIIIGKEVTRDFNC